MTGPPWARIQKYTSNAMLYMHFAIKGHKNRLGHNVLAYVYIPICLMSYCFKIYPAIFMAIVKAPAFLKPIVKAYTR